MVVADALVWEREREGERGLVVKEERRWKKSFSFWSVNNKAAGSLDRGGPAGIDLGLAWYGLWSVLVLCPSSLAVPFSCFSESLFCAVQRVHCSFLVSCCLTPCRLFPAVCPLSTVQAVSHTTPLKVPTYLPDDPPPPAVM